MFGAHSEGLHPRGPKQNRYIPGLGAPDLYMLPRLPLVDKRRSSEGYVASNPQTETYCITLLILAGDIEIGTQVPGFNPAFAKHIARHRIRSSNARTVKNAFTHHVPNLWRQ